MLQELTPSILTDNDVYTISTRIIDALSEAANGSDALSQVPNVPPEEYDRLD